MFCPRCSEENPAEAVVCSNCQHDTDYFRQRIYIGRQFTFARASDQHPIALAIDEEIQTYHSPVIFSRHQHTIRFGDTSESVNDSKAGQHRSLLERIGRQSRETREPGRQHLLPLPDTHRLPAPSLKLVSLVTDRKIYRPDGEATIFIVAPDAAGQEASLEVQIAGQKVYESKVTLNQEGLALHLYDDLREGEYSAVVSLPDSTQADCTFSVAEFTLSPLVVTLEKHAYMQNQLSFTMKVLLLSEPYSGSAEFGLQCGVCGDQVVATQEIMVKDGIVQGEFDVSQHGGPFHIQVVTPDGNTALVNFPGTGALERKHIKLNGLGETAEMGLLPWENAQPVRGFYVGSGEVDMTPLMLENVQAEKGRLKAASDLALAQIVTFNSRTGKSQVIEQANVKRGEIIQFEVEAPFTLFTVATFLANEEKAPFEGWGTVIKPVSFEATLRGPEKAQPGEEIDLYVEIPAIGSDDTPMPAFCWLLVYDARLEHESPIPKLAKRIYESVRDASGNLVAHSVEDGLSARWAPTEDFVGSGRRIFAESAPAPAMSAIMGTMAARPASMSSPKTRMSGAMLSDVALETEAPTMVMAPTRMEFPELAFQELFHFAGKTSRTVRLGDQIGTWRVRAYLFRGADYLELTHDVQADKPLYAELDLPAIASEGDKISAAVNYFSRETAELLIATPFGETRTQVKGSGMERFPIEGPGRIEVSLRARDDFDMSTRFVARPGVQKVTASHLRILDRGETAAGEKVVVYASLGQVLKDTITALTDYPFG